MAALQAPRWIARGQVPVLTAPCAGTRAGARRGDGRSRESNRGGGVWCAIHHVAHAHAAALLERVVFRAGVGGLRLRFGLAGQASALGALGVRLRGHHASGGQQLQTEQHGQCEHTTSCRRAHGLHEPRDVISA